MESRKYKHDRYLNKLEKHLESTEEAQKYSSDRFDILLVSLSTTGLILSIGFSKDIIQDLTATNTNLLKITWVLFAASLINNLISQITGFYANKYDLKITKNLIREERGKKPKGKQKILEWWCNIFNKGTLTLNGVSLLCLVAGIVILIIFFTDNI